MVCMLGIGVGLAITRLPGAHWFDCFLGAFLVWYTIGCWRHAAALARTARGANLLDAPTIRMAMVSRCLAPPVVALGMALLLGRRSGWDALKLEDFAYSQAFDFLSTGLIVLPVLALLPQMTPREIAAPGRRFGQFVRSVLGIVVGAALSFVIGANLMLITVLVHIAIHGIRQAQPLRYLGVQLAESSFDANATRLFNWGAVTAVILWLAAIICLWRFARDATFTDAPAQWRRAALAIALPVTTAALAAVVVVGGWLFVTQISPILGQYIWIDKPPLLWWLGAVFLATAGSWMTSKLLRAPRGSDRVDTVQVTMSPAPLLHQRLFVLLLPAAWWVCELIDTIRYGAPLGSLLREMPEFLFGNVSSLLLLAYSLSWVQFAWHQWKGYDASQLELARISPWRAAAVWLGSAAVIAAGGPVAAWINFALWTWPT